EANRLLGELNAYGKLIPDVDFFINMHVAKESTTSSMIEGTKTEINEAVMDKKDIGPEHIDDWLEVQSYTKAMNVSIKNLHKIALSIRLLKEAHKILLSNTRGKNKHPGEVRSSQNWIGGSSPKDAFFVPPHHSELGELLSDLEKFWHNDQIAVPHLIRAAISHYQFETIHPFLDGNGRIGRLLITLYLVSEDLLDRPALYLSDFFNRNRATYYDSLTMVRKSSDLTQWIKFFLSGIIESSKDSRKTFEQIVHLRASCEKRIATLGKRSPKALELLHYLFKRPTVDYKDVQECLELTHPAVNNMIQEFVRIKMLHEITGGKKNRLFEFSDYLNIFRK
ncbi:MAG: Fic family protein, partial [Bdellovibrionota bacterium]